MGHTKTFRYQIRCTNNKTGEEETYDIEWGVTISSIDNNLLASFTTDDGKHLAFPLSTDITVKIDFFEVES